MNTRKEISYVEQKVKIRSRGNTRRIKMRRRKMGKERRVEMIKEFRRDSEKV